MATSSRSPERFKYGICLNDECPLCKSKTVQQIPMRKDLICPECGKPLRETLPPKKKGLSKPILIGIIAAAIIIIALAICYFTGVFDGNKKIPTPVGPDTTKVEAPVDTTAKAVPDTTATVVQTDGSDSLNAKVEIAKAEAEKAKAEAERAKAEAEAAKAKANTRVSTPPSTSGTSTSGSLSLSYGR